MGKIYFRFKRLEITYRANEAITYKYSNKFNWNQKSTR